MLVCPGEDLTRWRFLSLYLWSSIWSNLSPEDQVEPSTLAFGQFHSSQMAPSLHFIPSDKPHFLSFPIRHPLPTRTSTWLCFPFEANVSTRDLFKGSGSQPLTCRLCAQCGVQWSDMSMAASSLLTMPHEVNSSKLAQLCKVLRSSYGEEEKSWGSIKHKLGRENPAGRRQLLPLLG